MSLFDIIKYQSINVTSKEELLTLPRELLILFWNEIHIDALPPSNPNYTSEQIAHLIGRWAGYTPVLNKRAKEIFNRALKKYNP
jgi:hypothetical protein